ncbi:MAG TPA: OmpH family outer membrane protein [Gemmatimonadales bacterium]|jgi:outer membrane protein|nr:OmpH family outer membrane protein [Gemmatimonadales bacterium]
MMTRTALVALALLGTATTTGVAQTRPSTGRPATTRPATPAQSPQAQKFAYLNSRAILAQTPGYAQAETTFSRELNTSREEVARLQASLDSAANDFETASVLLSPTAKQAKQRELVAQQQTVSQRQQELQDRMQARERELLEPLQRRVQDIINGIRAEMSLSMVFDVAAMGGAMVAADPSLDITPIVIQRMQAAPSR